VSYHDANFVNDRDSGPVGDRTGQQLFQVFHFSVALTLVFTPPRSPSSQPFSPLILLSFLPQITQQPHHTTMEQEDWDSTNQPLVPPSSARANLGDDASIHNRDNSNDIVLAADASTQPAVQSTDSHGLVVQEASLPTPFSHSPLAFRQSTTVRFPSQRVQALSSNHGRNRSPSDVRTIRNSLSRDRPASPRRRSRSPTTVMRPPLYRDRSQEITASSFQRVNSTDHGAGSVVVCSPEETARRLHLDKLRKEKNDHAVCVTCWRKELPCDHQWPCHECKTSGIPCAYLTCPLNRCPHDQKCPCYHKNKSLPQETPARKVGSYMHLLALLNLNRLSLNSYDLSRIQEELQRPDRAHHFYQQHQQEIEHLLQQEQGFHGHVALKLFRGSDKMPQLSDRALKTISRLIVELVKEKK